MNKPTDNPADPFKKALAEATKVMAMSNAAQADSRSIVFAEGKFVAPPIVKQAAALLSRASDLGLIPERQHDLEE